MGAPNSEVFQPGEIWMELAPPGIVGIVFWIGVISLILILIPRINKFIFHKVTLIALVYAVALNALGVYALYRFEQFLDKTRDAVLASSNLHHTNFDKIDVMFYFIIWGPSVLVLFYSIYRTIFKKMQIQPSELTT